MPDKPASDKPAKRTLAARPRETQAAANRGEALRLKISGCSYREIGARLGVHHSVAQEYVRDALAEHAATPEEAAHLREMERARLETVLQRMMALATRADLVIRTVKDGARGPVIITVEDYTAATKAADAVVKISARLAALYGLDGPSKVEHSGAVGMAVSADLAGQIAAARSARADASAPAAQPEVIVP